MPSLSPNHSTAAGTQATDGRLCRPVRTGPIADRTTGTVATRSPSGVPMITANTTPSPARLIEVQMIDSACPLPTSPPIWPNTASGEGSLNSGRIAEAHRICQTTTKSTTATIGGTHLVKKRGHHGTRRSVGVSSASSPRPTSTEPSTSRSSVSVPWSSAAMRGDHLAQLGGDGVVQLLGVGVGAGAPLPHNAARARGQEHHPLGQADRLPHVVGDEQDRRARRLPDAQQLGLQEVPGDRVQRAERLVHEQYAGLHLGGARAGRPGGGGERPGQRPAPRRPPAEALVGPLPPHPLGADRRGELAGAPPPLAPAAPRETQRQLDVAPR